MPRLDIQHGPDIHPEGIPGEPMRDPTIDYTDEPQEHLFDVPVTVTYEGVATVYAKDAVQAQAVAVSGAWDELTISVRSGIEVSGPVKAVIGGRA